MKLQQQIHRVAKAYIIDQNDMHSENISQNFILKDCLSSEGRKFIRICLQFNTFFLKILLGLYYCETAY